MQEAQERRQRAGHSSGAELQVVVEHCPELTCSLAPSTFVLPAAGAAVADGGCEPPTVNHNQSLGEVKRCPAAHAR